ncbi:uncharacterized protein [Montipora foliosa]|uniref:uncharacterized protein n=1 Tax=Montipora foliosa TaxID=591990 RepID=UPI0035F1DF53
MATHQTSQEPNLVFITPQEKLSDQRTKSRKDASIPHDIDDTSDEEDEEQTERPKPKKARGIIMGTNLEGIHDRYEGVLDIFKKKNCSLAQDFAVLRNTVRDYIGMCELKIIDVEKYHSVVQQERGRKGKVPIKKIELRCREALSGYRAQAKKLKEEGKLFPFYPNENFYAGK